MPNREPDAPKTPHSDKPKSPVLVERGTVLAHAAQAKHQLEVAMKAMEENDWSSWSCNVNRAIFSLRNAREAALESEANPNV